MPRVRMLQSIAGHADPRYKLDDFSFRPGDTPNVPKKLADAWCAAGTAEPMKAADAEPEATETAEQSAQETA